MTSEAERKVDLLEEEVERRRKNDKLQKWGLFWISVVAAMALGVCIPLLSGALEKVDSSAVQVSEEQAEKKEIATEAQRALCGTKDTEIFDQALCEKLAAVSQEPTVEAPDPDGPSRAELVAAFREYCDAGNCKGENGASPTAEDIAGAFVKFCADGRCKGPSGEDGKSLPPEYETVLLAVTDYCSTGVCIGAAGRDGSNATPEMVSAAVQAFCANDNCRGPAGKDGEDGTSVTQVSWVDPKTGDKYTCIPDPPGSSTLTCSVESSPGPLPDPIVPGATTP